MTTLKHIISIIGACIMLVACTPPVDGKAEKARIEGECAARGFKTRYDQVKCENNARLVSREQHGLNVSADYRQYLLERLKIAADLDAKRINAREADLRDQQAFLNYQKAAEVQDESDRKRRNEQKAKLDEKQQKMWERLRTPENDGLRCHSYCPTDDDCYTDCRPR